MSWFRSEFDKLLIGFFVLVFSGLVLVGNDKVQLFAIGLAGTLVGCLVTLVLPKRGQTPDPPDPTSSVTDTETNTKTKTILPPPA